ncbi:Dynein heavy chain 1, axonemal [Liparis tanakae]|uniref:Dynein heavy chain 1, axonemal n=1 Tax=Liparis tanakae TaxID=230148 RepID=A0A4Z2FJ07_9TELE|nr:Dynein heavy chain 1, axonemal [Liparis tanakae]
MVTRHPEEFSHVTLPPKGPEFLPQKGGVPPFPFQEYRQAFVRSSHLTTLEVVSVLSDVWSECNNVHNMRLFNVASVEPLRLVKFEDVQSQIHHQIGLFLRNSWVSTLSEGVRSRLLLCGKGTYNVDESRWDIYKFSKLYRLVGALRLQLQDALRVLVHNSLLSLTRLVADACRDVLTCPPDLAWGSSLNTSPYTPQKNPLFLLDLVLNHSGVHYSPPLEDFETSLVKLIDEAVKATHNFVMKNLFAGHGSVLNAVNVFQPEVVELREKVRNALRQAAIPLRAYAAEYEKHLEVHNVDVQTLLLSHTHAEQTSQEVKKEVEQNLSDMETLERCLPSAIAIGPFLVRVEAVRQALCNKRKALGHAMLEHFTQRLRNQIDNEVLDKTLSDYEVVEELLHNLSDDDFDQKWMAIKWPGKIFDQMEEVAVQHEEDEARFYKMQLVDRDSLEESIDSLKILISGFAAHTELDHAHEIANKVRSKSKQLQECQTMARTYNTRERLLGLPVTNVSEREATTSHLWTTTSDWLRWHDNWLKDPLSSIDPEQLESNATHAYRTMHKCVKLFDDVPECQAVATIVRSKIEDFQPSVQLIQGLANPAMKGRHWEMLSDRIQMKVRPNDKLTLSHCLELGLQNHVEEITHVAEVAGKEYAIEQALEKMEQEWSAIDFDVLPYKDTGTYILKSLDDVLQLLDDHIVVTQSMSFSPFKKTFEDRINTWESKLRMTQDVLEEWLTCQRSWLYLEPIFSSEDINQQLPVEAERYQRMYQIWKGIMQSAFNNRNVIELCQDANLLVKLKECNMRLEQVQKGLSEYLEKKRGSFPRFYFLSDDELLEILSQTKDPTAVQPHLRKCFENIARLQFQPDLQITHMYSGEGEEVKLSLPVRPTGNVEDWLRDVERSMKATLRDNIDRSLNVYPEQPRVEWVLSWPGQVVIAGCQVFWTSEVSEALEQGDLPNRLYPQLQKQLGDLVQLVRGRLSKMQRAVLSALIVIEVHAKDVAAKLVEQEVSSVNDFEWISQLRCYLTLTGALHLKFGGAPAGPAGTGKTETTKDLGKALAIQTVVFNCSDQLDFIAMGKFLKGLASSGAWACFDEFNRIDVEVLSVVAQQITTIQKAQQQRAERFVFEGTEIPLVPSCAVFITMNPGYAGRTELPDNLKALFRPVAMMVPDYAMIAEISLYSFGFSDAKVLSKKITSTFKLSSEQLSAQELICLRAIQDVNVPKFLQDDLKLFNGIVSDLFPRTKQEPIDYGALEESMRSVCTKKNLKDVDGYISKCIQLYETTVVRHGLMLVGPSGSGKTKCYEVLGEAITALKGQPSVSGGVYEAVHTYVLNPKAITMGQLYGEYDLLTHEW